MLDSWASSPTRLREDAAAEADLVRAGYRDRLCTELAQNAADAAAKAGIRGQLRVWAEPGELHFANTGAPLDTEGVQALSALRASRKTGAVGRFGVGFTAAAALSDDISVRSGTGAVRFSAALTARELRARGIAAAVRPPVLRLVWPETQAPAPGFATEIVVRLRADADPAALLAEMAAEAPELLLELPALHTITVDEREYRCETTPLASGIAEVQAGGSVWWQFRAPHARWLLPIRAGRPVALPPDVLRAPTRSDEELSLPAMLIADIAMQPDRRRILPGSDVGGLAAGYAGFAAALPPEHRLLLVPASGLPRGSTDEQLHEALLAELREHAWVPSCDGTTVAPARAQVIPGLTTELASVLAEVVAGLVIPELSSVRQAALLARTGVATLGFAALAEQLSGVARPPAWWHQLYAALEPLVTDPVAVAELGALPVPLADGRLVTGPRTALTFAGLDSDVPVCWARLVHPAAAHPLLERLGTRTATVGELLSDPALLHELDAGVTGLADAVLAIAAQAGTADELPDWLGLLELPDTHGALRPADELLLPDSPLATVLDVDTAIVAPAVVAQHGAHALRAIGVGWGFTVLREAYPTGPDHGLPAEREWWAGLSSEPEQLAAVVDLDLVADDQWPAALSLLASDPVIRPLLEDPAGYTAWWLRRHAHIGGVPLGALRPPADQTFAGLLDPLIHPDAGRLQAILAHPSRVDAVLAQELADALADPARTVPLPVITATHRLLAVADPAGVDAPPAVRTITGAVIAPESALVLDQAWLAPLLPPDRLVLGDIATAPGLADLLDVALASERVHGEVMSVGRPASWADEPVAVLARLTLALPEPHGDLIVHDNLVVRAPGVPGGQKTVSWWVDPAGHTHLNAGSFN